jgi:hypothetical protein
LPGGAVPHARYRFSGMGGATLGALVLLLFWLGVYPAPLISAAQHATAGLALSRASFRAADIAATPQSPILLTSARPTP